MADLERGIISKAIVSGDLLPALEAKITPEFFASTEHRRVWTWIIEYFGRYGETPSSRALKVEYPAYTLWRVDEPYQYYIDEMRSRRKFTLTQEGMESALTKLSNADVSQEEAAAAALAAIGSMLTSVGTETSRLRDVNIITTHEERMSRYRSYRDLPGGMRGLPSGIKGLDKLTLGWQDEQLITLAGIPKAGKSTFLLSWSLASHAAGATPLFVGFEMSNEEQEARMDSMLAKVNYSRLLSGRLSVKELDRMAEMLALRETLHPFILSSDISSATTVSGLAAKVKQFNPAILFVDGVYLMDDEHGEDKGSSQALTNITRGLKRLAQTHRIPVVCTTQALTWKTSKRQGMTQDSLGYTSSFAQDSDLVLGVEHIDDQPDVVKIRIIIGRNVGRADIRVSWDWETTTFDEVEAMSEDEEEAAETSALQYASYLGDDDDD